jgi:hypothetical protein
VIPSQASEPMKWVERYCGPPVMAKLQAAGDVRAELAPTVNDRVIDRLQGGEPVTHPGHEGPRLGGVGSTQANTHTHPSPRVQAMVASVPQRWLGAGE